jgi:hypothetical protein
MVAHHTANIRRSYKNVRIVKFEVRFYSKLQLQSDLSFGDGRSRFRLEEVVDICIKEIVVGCVG